jgi:hypothetical protein
MNAAAAVLSVLPLRKKEMALLLPIKGQDNLD